MANLTKEHVMAFLRWQEELLETIQCALAEESTMSVAEDEAAALVIFTRLMEYDMLAMPELPAKTFTAQMESAVVPDGY